MLFTKITGFSLALLCSLPLLAKQVDERLSVGADVQIEIENLRGKVEIIGTDNNEVWVIGKLDEKANDFVFEQQGDSVIIQVQMPSSTHNSFWDNDDEESNLTIEVPKNAAINFRGVSSDVVLNNLHSDTNIKTVSGNIYAENLHSRVELTSVSGDIKTEDLGGKIFLNTVSGNIKDKQSTGQLNYQAVSGDIDASSGAERVSASVISGNLEVVLARVVDAKLTSISGNVEVSMELSNDGLLKVSSVSGDVDVKFQQGVNAEFKVQSHAGGRIYNNLNDDKVDKAKHGPSSWLATITGTGSATVKASSVSGSINLHY